ncbi:hypothetical protein ABPG72_014611 [Tetrahymena utriculariae]
MKQSQNPQPYKIVDDYVIYQDKMLGNGSYGQVFQGINKNTKENVAIKVIPIKKIEAESQNPQVIFQQIKNEITNMQLIEGQHIVKLIDKKNMIFYEMLYRKVPWKADSPQDLLFQIQQKPLEFPAVPQVSLIVKKVISYMLKIEESDRISWEELINEPLFESQTKLDVLLQSLNSVEMRFVNDSFMKMKEYCRLYIEQNRVFHNLFECHQKETFNNVQSNNSNGGDGSGSHHQEIQNLYDYTIQLQKRQFIINKMTDYYLKKRNKGIFFAHLAILLSDIFDIRQNNQEVQNNVNEAFMLRHAIILFKKGYLKIYKALRRIKTNEPDQCTKFTLDDYKTFELSNERTQLRKYFNFDLNMLKCLFDELLQKIMAFIKKNLPNYPPQEKALYETFQPIFNNTMTEKEKFNPLFKQSVLEQNKLYRMIIKNITPQQLGTEQEQMDNNNIYKKLSSLAFYIDCVDKQYKMFKQDANLDYCKFYETYERSTSKTLINLVLNQV